MYRILVINPGSTSTKLSIFDDEVEIVKSNLNHEIEELSKFPHIINQFEFRKNVILDALKEWQVSMETIDAVVGRGGLLRPIQGGTYRVNAQMVSDLKRGVQGEHASNLGGLLAESIATSLGKPSFIVDPVVVDELDRVARISGMPDIKRRSIFHALNQKSVARLAAQELGKRYDEVNLIVAHLGGGISIGAHKKGKVVDVNNALNGDGPFAPERSGGLPVWDLVELALSGKYSKDELKKRITGKAGMVAYLGTNDMRKVMERIDSGDERPKIIFDAMAYQISKEIGGCAAVLKGKIDGIVLTGGLANCNKLIDIIKERVSFLGRILVYPGGDEMRALASGALRVLRGEEKAREYEE